jgi:membrane-associated phospholipid phosphatase
LGRYDIAELPFSIDLVQFLVDTRTGLLTAVFLFFTFLGEVEGYVLVIALIYVTYDKKLAFRLSVLTLVTMSLNHLLKTVVMNPRPFISEGSYSEKWAVSAAKAEELATEYSTPSGHAMAGSSFYTFLCASVKNGYVRVASMILILLIGLSRPYLGVHYLEDILIGWVLGITIALLAFSSAESIGNFWSRFSFKQQITVVAASSLMLWVSTRALSGWNTDGQPLAFISYTGLLTGIVIGYPLEAKRVDFDPRSSTVSSKVLRYTLSVAMVMGTLVLLDAGFAAMSADSSPLGNLLRFIRYAVAGIVGIFIGPLLFVKLGLAERIPKVSERPGSRRRQTA